MLAENLTNKIIILSRDCFATLVPAGARIMLHEGTEVQVTQALGHSYTVNVYGNLARIEGVDADVLGLEPHDPFADLPQDASLEERVWVLLRSVYDPEIPVNIVELGLVYGCEISEVGLEGQYQVKITMTLTAPGCGMGPVIADDVKRKIESLPTVVEVMVDVVFDPPWSQEMMSEAARLELGMF